MVDSTVPHSYHTQTYLAALKYGRSVNASENGLNMSFGRQKIVVGSGYFYHVIIFYTHIFHLSLFSIN